jgi:hypothetical protein
MAQRRLQRVLVINADILSHETITLALPRSAFDVVMETDPDIALKVALRSSRPIVIIVDFSVTRWQVSGQFLKSVVIHPDIVRRHAYVLLLSTTETVPLDIGQSLTLLAPTILAKPLTTGMIFATVGAAAARITVSPAPAPKEDGDEPHLA